VTTLRVEAAERTEYAYELPLQDPGFSNAEPQATGSGVRYTAFGFDGYQVVTQEEGGLAMGLAIDPPADASEDDLSFANREGHLWVEQAGARGSQIVDVSEASRVVVSDARDPMISADGKELAFVRDERGRGRLMARGLDGGAEKALTPAEMNVYEAAFLSEDEYAFAATQGGEWPHIYVVDHARGEAARGSSMQIADARYPAISPDGRWLAYSHIQNGVWNLWLMDLASGAGRRIGDVPCNEVQPSWESDSKTLLYGTDCGRSVWFTAVARRRIVP
jgi:dipeptidyl aminopeptidase/acylaminoacyl peptidase